MPHRRSFQGELVPLDPEIQTIVDFINSMDQPPPSSMTPEEMRDSFAGLVAAFGPGPAEVETEDLTFPGPVGPVAIRVYRPPTDPSGAATTRPGVAVYFHGGGWVIGTIDTNDPLCRDLAARSGCVVVSVEYRLAPEHPYPAALEDCLAATRWVAEHGDTLGVDSTRLAVAGDSAGGQLATIVARHCRDDATLPDPLLQVLIYPVTDLAVFPLDVAAGGSLVENGTGYVLTTETMEYFTTAYVPDPADRFPADASPLRADDLAGLAAALVLTAEYDPLRDEGEAYAKRLTDAGVPTTLSRYEGATHMFVQMNTTQIADRAIDELAAALRARLG